MSSQLRATRPEDAPALAQFLKSVFGMDETNPVIAPAHMQWKYWREYGEWEGSRGFVIERDNEMIAHGAVVPLPCRWGDKRLRIVNLIDWAARPDSPGAGISLLKRVAQMVDGVLVSGVSETAEKILPALGFKDAAKATGFAQPLRPLKRLLGDTHKSWRSGARLARNMLWKLKAPPISVNGWTARRLGPECLDSPGFPLPHPTVEASAVFERSSAAMAWFLECPAAPAELYAVEKNGVAAGYFVLTLALAQARIADAWIESGRIEDWASLYQLAVVRSREHAHVAEVATVTTVRVVADALRQIGFQERGHVNVRFLLRGGYPHDIRYQLLDGDGAYLHDGRESFWT